MGIEVTAERFFGQRKHGVGKAADPLLLRLCINACISEQREKTKIQTF